MRGWNLSRPPNEPFVLNKDSQQGQGISLWLPGLASRGINLMRDLSGFGWDGAPTNMDLTTVWQPDPERGFCLKLDSSNDYLDLGSTPTLVESSTPCTIVWREKITADTNSYPARFRLKVLNGGSNSGLSVLRPNSGGSSYAPLSWGVWSGGSGYRAASAPSVSSCVGLWKTFALQLPSGPSTPSAGVLFVDGVVYSTSAATTFTAQSNTVNQIGWDGLDHGPDCMIDDFRVYGSRVLTADEIWQIVDQRTQWELYFVLGRTTYSFKRQVVNTTITPPTASLTTTRYAPAVSTPRLVTPPTKSLATTKYAPVVSTPRLATPPTKALATTRYAPTVSTPRVVTPPTAELITTACEPDITVALRPSHFLSVTSGNFLGTSPNKTWQDEADILTNDALVGSVTAGLGNGDFSDALKFGDIDLSANDYVTEVWVTIYGYGTGLVLGSSAQLWLSGSNFANDIGKAETVTGDITYRFGHDQGLIVDSLLATDIPDVDFVLAYHNTNASSTGANSPEIQHADLEIYSTDQATHFTTCVSEDTFGTGVTAWTKPGRGLGYGDGLFAEGNANADVTECLKFGGINIEPTLGSTSIDEIRVIVTKSADQSLRIVDEEVYLYLGGTRGPNMADVTTWPTTPAETTYTWSGADLDGLGIDDLPDLFFIISGRNNASGGVSCAAEARIEVDFGEPGPITVTPGCRSVTLTGYAPTVSTPRLVTPGAAALATTRYAPTVGRICTPGTASLTTTRYAPTVSTPRLVTPPTNNVTTTKYAPVLKLGVIPPTRSVVTTTFAPSIVTPRTVTPPTAGIVLTRHVPVLKLSVIPPTASVSITVFAPTIKHTIIPGTKSVATTRYAPTVVNPRTVTPPTKSLTLTTFIPTIIVGGPQVVTPGTASLTITTFAPNVDSGGYVGRRAGRRGMHSGCIMGGV